MKLRKTSFLLTALLLSSLINSCISKENIPKPNIVLILADDLGYGDLGCYGQEYFSTPNIDRLADEGMKFTQHYSGSTVCAPSRCVLMTGKHTGNSFTRGNAQNPDGDGQLPLPPGEETFVMYLKQAGYATGIFGKWGLGNAGTVGDPLNHGFDYFFGYHDQILAHNSYPEFLIRNSKKIFLNNKVKYLSDTLWHKGLGSYSTRKVDYSNDIIFDEMLKFIDQNKDQNFFAYYPTTIPHDNGEAEIGKRFEVPDNSKYANENWSEDEKSYAALVEHLDMQIGKLNDFLDENNLAENTIVIFTSDNGPLPTLGLNSNGNLRGHKRDLYEGGIRVPLIVKWPGNVKPGSVSDHESAFWDFFPTFCEIAGTERYPVNDGISFLPVLLNEKQKKHEYLYWEFHWWKTPKQAVRIGKWKAVKNSPESEVELYDLEQDMGEQHNVSADYPEKVDSAKYLFISARSESEIFKLNSK